MPDSLEIKSNQGHTPLALAFSLHRLDAAKVLIAAGADQTVRDSNGANILHLVLCSAYTSTCRDETKLQEFLDLLDKRLVPSLLTERSSHSPGSLSPIARWMRNSYLSGELMRVLFDFAKPYGNEHLEMLDGSGDTPLHHAVKSKKQSWLKIMLEYRPDLLYRENSVGRTPYELAEDAYIGSCVSNAPQISRNNATTSIVSMNAESFVNDHKSFESVNTESIWRVCEQFMKDHPGKRRLVSLLDANEVAKRLANRHGGRHNGRGGDDDSDAESDDGTSNDNMDEVGQWYRSAPSS